MFTDAVFEKIFAHEEMQKIPIGCQSTAVHVFEEILVDWRKIHMSTYPSYSFQPQQMNNQYQGSYQPVQNPYIAQIGQYQQNFQPQVQQMQQQQQAQRLVCKPVVDASNVSPNDVPMDGNAAVFSKNDFSEIYVKSWTSNGTIQTIVYKPVQPENQSE